MKLKTRIEEINDQKNISGSHNQNLKVIEQLYNIELDIHGGNIIVNSNEKQEKLEEMFTHLIYLSTKGVQIHERDIIYLKSIIDANKISDFKKLYEGRKVIGYTFNNKPIYPKTLKQLEYVKALDNTDLIFSIGSAGTGKTYLSIVHAVTQLKNGKIKKLILTRPAVEAGESLGFLPGDLKDKIDPYLRPLYDALYDTFGIEQTNNLIEKNVIEIAPLAYMRGRTLENAYIILDEAQNTTTLQMKMFLTRLGFNSKMVVTGDISQIDLPSGKKSGLVEATNLLKNIPNIEVIEFDRYDVIRHPLVARILERYENIK